MKRKKLQTNNENSIVTKNNNRKQRGETDGSVMFPVAPSEAELPEDYVRWFADLKADIAQTRLQVVLASNKTMVLLYWDIGKRILNKQENQGWGARIIDRLALDLRKAFPEMKGFSPRNLKYMRAFAKTWPKHVIVQEVLAQLPWYHNITLLEKLKTEGERLWYASKAYEHGWSRNILAIQIEAQAHIQKFLLELGQGFSFVGQQVHLELGDQDFYLDLLFYHLKLRRYIVLEIKARKFKVGDGAQLGMYMTAVDKLLKHPDDKPTLGLLLVRGKNEVLVEYALGGMKKPMSVAEWETKLTQSLPDDLRDSLPTVDELEAELKKDNDE